MSKFYDKHGSGNDESLSAFLDNEATHADIEALLASDIKTLATKMDHYQQIHQAIQPEHDLIITDSASFLAQMHSKLDEGMQDTNVVAFPGSSHALAKPEKLQQVSLPDMEAATKAASKRSFFQGLAVAASVAFVVVMGGNFLLEGNDPVATTTFAAAPSPQIAPLEPVNGLTAEEALENNERLQNYLRQHAQQASMTVGQGMIPMAKVVGYPQGNAE